MDEKLGVQTPAAKRSHQVPVGGFLRLEEFRSGSASPVVRVHTSATASLPSDLPTWLGMVCLSSFGQSDVIRNFLFVAADHLNGRSGICLWWRRH